MEQEEKKISKYSSGVNILMRLDSLWKDTHLHSRVGLFTQWNADLDRIWLELVRDLNENEYEKKKKKFDEFDTLIKKEGDFEDKAEEGFDEISKVQITKRSKHYKILMDKQLFLSRLENELGKGTTFDDDDADDFD